jgi:hypothetical protein
MKGLRHSRLWLDAKIIPGLPRPSQSAGQPKAPGLAVPSSLLARADEVRKWPKVLKKSFLTNERKFLGPLMRLVCGDVRDHIVTPKIDHGPSWRR